MASQKQNVKDALNELSGLYLSREKIQAKRSKELAPIQAVYDEASKDIIEKFDKQAAPVNIRIVALEKEVAAQMLAKLDADGTPKLGSVESDNLKAECSFSQTRTVDPETFIREAKGKAGWWDCLTVLVGKAEKLLGKNELDRIAKPERKWRVSIISKTK